MKNFIVDLKKEYGTKGGKLECLLADHNDVWGGVSETYCRPAVVVVPGGAYAGTSHREGAPVAANFFARGYQVFILFYEAHSQGVAYPEELIELGAAVDYIKKNAKALCVNPEEVFAVGFSAGGHLVGNLAIEYASVGEKAGKPLDCKPKAVGLCYPVIYEEGHRGSFINLLDGYEGEERAALLSVLNLDASVTKDTPPAFIWSTAEDSAVPSQNALRYALALAKNKIPYELHVYPHGEHGLSTCDYEINAGRQRFMRDNAQWMDACAKFFRSFCEESF